MTAATGGYRLLVIILASVVAVDLVTKAIIERTFLVNERVDVLGSFIRLTYIHNPGAAFGINVGASSRVIFMALSAVALVVLLWMYAYTPAPDRVRRWAIALICGGALGNLIDRIRSPRGVVDFVDVGVGSLRWPVFNVADMAVTMGAIVLAISLWREEKRPPAASAGQGSET